MYAIYIFYKLLPLSSCVPFSQLKSLFTSFGVVRFSWKYAIIEARSNNIVLIIHSIALDVIRTTQTSNTLIHDLDIPLYYHQFKALEHVIVMHAPTPYTCNSTYTRWVWSSQPFPTRCFVIIKSCVRNEIVSIRVNSEISVQQPERRDTLIVLVRSLTGLMTENWRNGTEVTALDRLVGQWRLQSLSPS